MTTSQDIRDIFKRMNEDRTEVNKRLDELNRTFNEFKTEITGALAALPGNMAAIVHDCQRYQEERRRWSFGQIVSMVLAIIALVISGISIKGCM